MPTLTSRTDAIAPFRVMQILTRARELEAAGRDIIHMEVGEPDFETPAPIRAAAARLLDRGGIYYTPAFGLPALREAIAVDYGQRHGVHVDPSRIALTAGASGALLLTLAAFFGPGDELLMADPGYPCNRHILRAFEGQSVPLPVGPESNFQPTARQVEAAWTPATRGVLIATPANPTGTLIDASELAAIHQVVRARGGVLLVDEIYAGLIYDETPKSAVALGDDVVVINSFSKTWSMTGWRLGWLIMPPTAISAIERLAQNLFISPSTLAQEAALAAFDDETLAIVTTRREEFRARRDLLAPALESIGLPVVAQPQGAFYLYVDCSGWGGDSEKLATRWLESANVAVTPGTDFGSHRAQQHLRVAYTTRKERLEEAVARLARARG